MRRLALAAALLGACADWDSLVADHSDAGTAADLSVGPDLAQPDLAPTPDLESSCASGIRDGDESDVDCGGSCPPCDVGHACAAAADCQTRTCDNSVCELTSGPPGWTTLPPTASGPPSQRLGLAAASGNGLIFAIGGATSSSGSSNTVETYNADTNTWGGGSGPGAWRAWYALASTGDYIFAIGGNSGGTSPAGIERGATTPFAGFSAMGGGLSWGGLGPAATAAGGAVYILGGTWTDNGAPSATAHNTVQRFTPMATAFDAPAPPSFAVARSFGAAATGSDGRIYVIGGNDGSRALSSVEAWTPSPPAAAWASAAPMRRTRELVAAVAAPDGRIYAVGGGDRQNGALRNDVEAYSPSHNRWAAAASMAQTRWAHAAAVGSDGRIFAIGGSNLSGYLTTVEAYGPILSIPPGSVAVGDTLAISGSNFAANANVVIRFGAATAAGSASVTTSASGSFGPLNVTVPALAKGDTRIFAVDDRSRYPVSTPLTIK